jgi:hypothetical protein
VSKRFEYKIVDRELDILAPVAEAEAVLNSFGAEGWEPAWAPHAHPDNKTVRFWLKREVE